MKTYSIYAITPSISSERMNYNSIIIIHLHVFYNAYLLYNNNILLMLSVYLVFPHSKDITKVL